jgi:OFA family oxalate/formate antiporter-like MFS transporter
MSTSTPAGGNRWLIALAGIVVMLCLGTVYSWSIFTQPLVAAFDWSVQDVTLAFELAIFSLGVGAVIGGLWQDRAGPRPVVVTGAVLWGAGVLLAGLGTAHFGKGWLYLTYGVIGGLGLGMGYITPVAVVTKWFPDRRGLGSGLVVMGFGLGAFVYNQIVPRLPSFKAAATAAAAFFKARDAAIKSGTTFNPSSYQLSPQQIHDVMMVFVISGLVFAILGGLCAMMLRNPPQGYALAGAPAGSDASYGYTPGEALRTPQFYALWLLLFLNVTAGILVISNAVPIYSELTKAIPAVAASIYGLVAIFNALGRFFWGAVSDRLGRAMTYTVMYLIQAVVFFAMAHLHTLGAVGLAFAIVLLCYGGGFGVMPSFNADFFGTRFMGQNYGMILTAWGVAGVVGPFIAARVKDLTGSYSGALMPVAIMLLVASVIPFFVKRPAPATAKT